MNTVKLTTSNLRRRKAMALVLVIITVALLSILIVAIFSITRTEYRATQNYVAARSAKQLADVSVAIVEAQIQNAQNYTAGPSRTIHATQPGMVRVYNAQGNFLKANKLYSSGKMVVTGSSEAVLFAPAEQVPSAWKSMPARYVDLNEPVVRPGAVAGTTVVFFPVIDPRAAYNSLGSNPPAANDPTTRVEGFSYEKQTPQITGSTSVTYNEVVLPDAGVEPEQLRLPMPVEWIYVLQDGTTGALDASNNFVSSSGVAPTVSNPIVGRVAFWTDDESCKVNINTASEPTYFASPYFYSQRDSKWANFPGITGEFQRYPGHPATVALSAILAPGINLDPLAINANVNNVVQTKEAIYKIIPKIPQGGSLAGTLPFGLDVFSSANGENATAKIADASAVRSQRLFASVDEMLFREDEFSQMNGRQAARVPLPGQANRWLFDQETLERSRFFLTAHSRSPEFSIFGLPRVAMWPVADESLGLNRRTSFDNMIALCSTLRGTSAGASVSNSYVFRRAQAHHDTYDLTGTAGLRRNSQLLDYLFTQMSGLIWPQISSLGSSPNYSQKYGRRNVAQLAVQFFDYIRSTNLYDGVLARENDGTQQSSQPIYVRADNLADQAYTYTNQRISRPATGLNEGTTTIGSDYLTDDSGILPGHGTVTPATWAKDGTSYRGMGRMITLSEVGFHFICTADGKNDQFAVNRGGVLSGGGSAPKTTSTSIGDSRRASNYNTLAVDPQTGHKPRWYSNFPPLLVTNNVKSIPTNLYGCDATMPGDNHPSNHPGYNPRNWNMTLQNATPLLQNQKRVQAMIQLEAFCPMLGWTSFFPEYVITLDKEFVSKLTLNDQPLWDTTDDVILTVKSNGNAYAQGSNTHPVGGHAGPTAMANSRLSRNIAGYGEVKLPSDGFEYTNTQGHNALSNFGLVSNFITVDRTKPMVLRCGKRQVRISIYDSHLAQQKNRQPIQTIDIDFPAQSFLPVPALAYSTQRGGSGDPQDAFFNGNEAAGQPNELDVYQKTDALGRLIYWRSLQAPHWWCFNRTGCLGILDGAVNSNYRDGIDPPSEFWQFGPGTWAPGTDPDPFRQVMGGRLDTTNTMVGHQASYGSAQGVGLIPREYNLTGLKDIETGQLWSGFDVIRTVVPAVGDYRLVMGRKAVPTSMWKLHPMWESENAKWSGNPLNAAKKIHSFSNFNATSDGQFGKLVQNGQYSNDRMPDLPAEETSAPITSYERIAQSYGDFDNGIGNARDGPYVNKPDEGNFYMGEFTRFNQRKFYRSGYFYDTWLNADDWRSGVYVTPNRLISSPVMFGSLPTGVWPDSPHPGAAQGVPLPGNQTFTEGKPWQTLLFRPATSHGRPVTNPGHPGDNNPRDHFLLDMFCMPVVEPYAISEPLSVAGRLNINYQIMPFTNITRATAMHALMKGEFITTIPNTADINRAKQFASSTTSDWSGSGDKFWDEKTHRKFWHRPIDVEETLRQFEEKFALKGTGPNQTAQRFSGLFRSASQICEIHLIPDLKNGFSSDGERPASLKGMTNGNTRQSQMDTFWQNHSPTGDNVRERPYSNLYARITTRSNTFRVHMRAQMVRKARSVAANTFDPTKDTVTGEYRGSALIERYIDPTDTTAPIPDYVLNPLGAAPLDTYYKFRTLESKRFSP